MAGGCRGGYKYDNMNIMNPMRLYLNRHTTPYMYYVVLCTKYISSQFILSPFVIENRSIERDNTTIKFTAYQPPFHPPQWPLHPTPPKSLQCPAHHIA